MKKRKVSDKAVDYILSRNLERLRYLKASNIAEYIGANRSYLSRRFKMEQNISLKDFILREKIHRAIFILEMNPGKSIQELSTELGFLKVEDFDEEFRNYMTVEPERYRYLKKNFSGDRR
ncbi:MAG: helix-turn-helix domain-containing protein [Candidatus Aminicenantes bacterium]|nr:helix-turn-helix domain-containing protein [Candidatus Aminicenantes bacterium]